MTKTVAKSSAQNFVQLISAKKNLKFISLIDVGTKFETLSAGYLIEQPQKIKSRTDCKTFFTKAVKFATKLAS